MNNTVFGAGFLKSFEKHKKLICEHFSISESHYEGLPRDVMGRVDSEDVNYELVKSKGQISKVIANVSGNMSGPFTKLIQKMEELKALEETIIQMNEELKQEGGREKIAELFGAEFEFVTRVVRTVSSFELFLTKNPKAAETTKWAEVYKELSEKLTPELLEVGKAIVKKHTTTQDPKPPSLKISKIGDVNEGLMDLGKSFIESLKRWGRIFDNRLDNLNKKIEQLA
jgi:hypothetical protein